MKREEKNLIIAGKTFNSRLIIGTGKYSNYTTNKKALEASGAEILTVAMRRVNIENNNEQKLTDYINPKKYTCMTNTTGCCNSNDSLRTQNLAKESRGWNMVKLEVVSDKQRL